ncbi:MAG: hypothetical protein CL930_07105 [Deltaproteobacteria bacterium]|nr:hypothetical protein [Deltaproteobacteria bacterium]
MRIHSEAAIFSVLETVPIFQNLDGDSIRELAVASSMSELEDLDLLFKEGEEANEVYLVIKGSIRLTCDTEEGPSIVVGYAQSGDVLGEMAIIDPAPRSATARAAESAVVLHIPAEAMTGFLDKGHPVAQVLLVAVRQMMTHRIRILNQRIGALFLIDHESEAAEEAESVASRLREIWSMMRSGG